MFQCCENDEHCTQPCRSHPDYPMNPIPRGGILTCPMEPIEGTGHFKACSTPTECPLKSICKKHYYSPEVTAKRVKMAMDRRSAQEVIESREAAHGDYRQQAQTAQQLKTIIRDKFPYSGDASLDSPMIESLEMIAVKLSRILNGSPDEPDHWTDIAGYATLVSNLLTKGTHL